MTMHRQWRKDKTKMSLYLFLRLSAYTFVSPSVRLSSAFQCCIYIIYIYIYYIQCIYIYIMYMFISICPSTSFYVHQILSAHLCVLLRVCLSIYLAPCWNLTKALYIHLSLCTHFTMALTAHAGIEAWLRSHEFKLDWTLIRKSVKWD